MTGPPSFLGFSFRDSPEMISYAWLYSMVLGGYLVLAGITYLLVLIFTIAFHHYFFDRNAEVVPDFIKEARDMNDDADETYESTYDLVSLSEDGVRGLITFTTSPSTIMAGLQKISDNLGIEEHNTGGGGSDGMTSRKKPM